MRPSTIGATLFAAASFLYASFALAAGAADIARGSDGLTWRVSAGGATLTLRLGPDTDFTVLQLTSSDDRVITAASKSDATITIGGRALAFGKAADGFAFERADVVADGPRNRLDVVYTLTEQKLRV